MILFFVFCLLNQNTDGYLHRWLKIDEGNIFLKDSNIHFKISVHVNNNSLQEVSESKEENKPFVFIHDEDNSIRISNKTLIEVFGYNKPPNPPSVIDDNEHHSGDINFNETKQDLEKELSMIFNEPSISALDNEITCNNSIGMCEELPNYPNDLLEKQLNSNPAFQYMQVNETNFRPNEVSIENRFGGSTLQPLCRSKIQYLKPKTARTERDEMLIVVNNENFVQMIEVELCESERIACDFAENFPVGYTSECHQQYVYRKLLALDLNNMLGPKIFKIPAGCCCGVRFHEGFR